MEEEGVAFISARKDCEVKIGADVKDIRYVVLQLYASFECRYYLLHEKKLKI